MEIIYHPEFDGHIYIKSNALIMNKAYVGTAQLQDELELRSGMSYGEVKEEERIAEYYNVLKNVIGQGHLLYASFKNDTPPNQTSREKLTVTETLLRWRDSLIMAGWDRLKDLPGGKLKAISDAEKNIAANSVIRKGRADRWLDLSGAGSCSGMNISVKCSSVLIPEVVRQVLKKYSVPVDTEEDLNGLDIKKGNINLLEFKELTDAYKWLADSSVIAEQVIVCRDTDRLDSVLKSFHKPAAVKAQVGAHKVVHDIRDTADAPKSLIWLDCNGRYNYDYPYKFLSKNDRSALTTIGIKVPAEDDILAATKNEVYRHLTAVSGDVVIVKSDYDCGEKLPEHPLVTELRSMNIAATLTSAPSMSGSTQAESVIKLTPSAKLKVIGSCVPKNVTMSKSSLEQLIQFPFDFVTERAAGLFEPDKPDDLTTEKGNVAHKVVELMVDDFIKNGTALSAANLNKYFQSALAAKGRKGDVIGEELMKTENAIELDEFKTTLGQSLGVLFDIIQKNNLTPVKSEMRIPKHPNTGVSLVGIPGIWKGYLDLVLKTVDGKYVIFDFKYSTSDKHKKALENNTSIQFEVYRHLFDQLSGLGEVAACAYYLFPLATMFITDDDQKATGLKHSNIEVVTVDHAKKAKRLWQIIADSYKVRMDQLDNGIVEQGEEMKLSLLDYQKQFENPTTPELYPLDTAYKKPEIKGSPYNASHIVLKNQIR